MGWESTVRNAAAHGWNSDDLSAEDLREAMLALDAARAEIERLRTAAADERADVIAALADRAARARSYPRTDLGDGVADALDDMAEEIRSGAHVGAAKGGDHG